MTHNLERFTGLQQDGDYMPPVVQAPTREGLGLGVRKRIDFMASHIFYQLKEHETAQKRTEATFDQLLRQLEETVVGFQQSFLNREIPIGSVYAKIDSDRSVGMLYLLWHTLSFTMRGNTKPLALKRNGRDPMFAGRIVALLGDYHDNVRALHSQDYPDVLEDELASLYIPASPVQPAVMRFRHSTDELFFHQAEASQQFLLKILEAVCSGGYFHETI